MAGSARGRRPPKRPWCVWKTPGNGPPTKQKGQPTAIPAGQTPKRLYSHSGEVHAVLFSADGKLAFSAAHDGKVRRWNLAQGKELPMLTGHPGGAFALALAQDGSRLATAGADGKVQVHETSTGRLLHTLVGHKAGAFAVAWSPDGRHLASGGGDGLVRLWGPEIGRLNRTIRITDGKVASIEFTPDSEKLLTGSIGGGGSIYNGTVFPRPIADAVRIWTVKHGKLSEELKWDGHKVQLSRDGRLLLATCLRTAMVINSDKEGPFTVFSGRVTLDDAKTRKVHLELEGCGTAVLSSDGRFLATGPGSDFLSAARHGTIGRIPIQFLIAGCGKQPRAKKSCVIPVKRR